MGYEKLEKNLIDILKEEQAKLGYFPGEVRLYYPLSSLNHFFDSNDTADDMQARLEHLPDTITEVLGQVEASHKNDRFCFVIPEEGSKYVHDHTEANEFIRELVNLLARHDCTMEEIEALFHAQSEHVIKTKMESDEFDYLLRFEDASEDPYYYCFKDEGCHIIYHRFLKEDYEDFGF